MADPTAAQQAVVDTASSTVTIVSTDTQDADIPTLKLRLKKPKNDKKVQWTTETVDNEDMNKKKSKCCCIFNKPKKFDDSSSEDSDDECDHCHGHVEKRKIKQVSEVTETVENIPNSSNNNGTDSNINPNQTPSV